MFFFSSLLLDVKYDIIFIDGLYTFEQTYRDFCNALLHSHDRTVIIIDDTKPIDIYSAIPDMQKAIRLRKESGNSAGVWPGDWHGDVYKVIFGLHDFHLGLNYRTTSNLGNPQTLIWRSKKGWRQPLYNSFETISRLTYFDLLDEISALRLCPEKEAMNLCLNEVAENKNHSIIC